MKRIRSPLPAGGAVADLDPAHLDRADAGLDRAFRAMAVPDDALPAVGEPPIGHRGQKGLGLRLDRLGEQPARAGAQDLGQWIIDRSGCAKRTMVVFSFMAYRSPREVLAGSTTRLDTPPSSTVITQFPP